MSISLICFGAMRDYLPSGSTSNRVTVDVPDGATVGDAVDALGAPRKLVFAILVNGVQGSIEDPVPPDAEITLMPPFAGGDGGYP